MTEQEFHQAIGKLNLLVLTMDSAPARLALDCILYQEDLIHALRERVEEHDRLERESGR